jgi:hypothetical protein
MSQILGEAGTAMAPRSSYTFANLGRDAGEFTLDAIDHAMQNAVTAPAGFIPFALTMAVDGSLSMMRFVDDDGTNPTVEGGVALGRQALRSVDVSTRCVALAWDGYLTYGEGRTEAVFVEGYELGRPAGVLLAQRYERRNGGLSRIGNPLLCEEPQPLVPPGRR